jgi:hypothetical protein
MLAKSGAAYQGPSGGAPCSRSMRVHLAEHDLPCQNVQHATLASCLEITWSYHKAAQGDCEDVV